MRSPSQIRNRKFVAILLTGGKGGSEQQDSAQLLADALGIRTALLTDVPNQAIIEGKKEDDLLSYTLDQYRRSGDPSWPLLFPMVSSVVKGIDVLEQVLGEKDLKVIVIGASKRGWTTYLSGASDPRIAAIVPAVFEMVSIPKQVALARSRYGRDSEKIRPYTALGLTDNLLEPRVAQLVKWLDPVQYAPKLTMPKLVLLGANDPYWVVDSVREYWDTLPEPKMLRILPNVGHSALSEKEGLEAVVAFSQRVIDNEPLPQVSWKEVSASDSTLSTSGTSAAKIARCTLWQAHTDDSDFRQAEFSQTPCTVSPDGHTFETRAEVPQGKNTAAFATVETSDKLLFSTQPRVRLK